YDDSRYAYQLQREQARRQREWQSQNRVCYGERTYVMPPPTVYYAPPPPPSGLNLMFDFGR
ncbi:MAG: hypothetical protein JWM91_101, partial [Rhodospirillales bacterium]|nr:hypothetical protein [Rhodospirillales bacterium]